MAENGVFQLGRQRVGESLHRRFHVKGDERSDQGLDLSRRDFGNMIGKGKSKARADRISGGVGDGGIDIRIAHLRTRADLNVAQEAMLRIGSAVEIEDDSGAVDLDIGDDHAGARLGREAFADDHVQIALAGRLQLAVGRQCEPLVAARKRAHGKSLLRLESSNQLEARLGIQRGFIQCDVSGFDLRVPPIHRAGGCNISLALGIDGDDLGRARGGGKKRGQSTYADHAREGPVYAVVRGGFGSRRLNSWAQLLGKETPLHGDLPWVRTLWDKPYETDLARQTLALFGVKWQMGKYREQGNEGARTTGLLDHGARKTET